jgi:hypothetical protein
MCAPARLPASTRLRVAPTYEAQAAARSRYRRAKSLRIAPCTMASGAVSATLRRTAAASVRSTSVDGGATTSAPWASRTGTRFEPKKPRPPVT